MAVLLGCKEESIGQYPTDGTPPQKISNPTVTNIKGGAIISYMLPNEKDILYVKAEYTLPNGQKKEMRSSAFANTVKVMGYSRSVKSEVKLISVDRSRNESEPVICEIEPFDSPIFDVVRSVTVIPGFGGIKLNWENPEKADVVVGVLLKNDELIYESIDNIYTSVAAGNASVRGISDGEKDFGIYVRDIYYNYSDTVFLTLTPWKEVKLDSKLWRGGTICSNTFTISPYGTGNLSILWNGATTIESASEMVYINNSVATPIFISLDLGVTSKLSRFRFWGRYQYSFTLHHPKEFEIWGTNDVNAFNDPCSFDGWTKLIEGISTKPSGPDAVAFAQLTSEDVALAIAGEEYEFPLEVPSVRYVRYRCMRTWTNSTSMFLTELAFWGNPQ